MTIAISKRAQALKPSPTMAVDAMAKKMIAEGLSIINFGVGEPDFTTPEYIKLAAHQAIDNNFTRYTASAGILDLRQAIIAKLKRDNGLDYQLTDILVTPGGKPAIIDILLATCDPGDEVLIPSPYWVSYPAQVGLCDGIPVILDTDESTNFKITAVQLEKTLAGLKKPKALILNSPSNPTGAVYSRAELAEIGAVCLKYNLLIISDEIYEKLVYDNIHHHSIASISAEIKANTVIINGVSKAYAMTGWRLGYAVGPTEIIKKAIAIQEQTVSSVNSITQKAAVAALNTDDGSIEAMRREFEKRRNYLVSELRNDPRLECPQPDGAFYVFPNVSAYYSSTGITNSFELCEYLLKHNHIAIVPGGAFGRDKCVRFSYATSMENIIEGIKRFKAGLKSLS